jgi:hypothetical protein
VQAVRLDVIVAVIAGGGILMEAMSLDVIVTVADRRILMKTVSLDLFVGALFIFVDVKAAALVGHVNSPHLNIEPALRG